MRFRVWVLAVSWLTSTGVATAQESNAARDLESPYAAVRAAAVQRLRDEPPAPDRLSSWLTSGPRRRRLAAADLCLELDDATAPIGILEDAVAATEDGELRAELADRLMARRMRLFDRLRDGRRDEDADEYVLLGVRRFVRRTLRRLSEAGVVWSDDRQLSSFVALGRVVIPALHSIILDEEVPAAERALGIMALARTDDRSFWTDAQGRPTAQFSSILDHDSTTLRLAALYGASACGIDDEPFVRRVAEYTRRDAFDADLIQAGLYFLYTLPDAAIAAAGDGLDEVLDEFLEPGYSPKVVYGASYLWNRRPSVERSRDRAARLHDDVGFHTYWLVVAWVESFGSEPTDADRETIRRELNRLVESSEADPVPPQVRGVAYWYLRERFGGAPATPSLDRLQVEIRESTRTLHPQEIDPDSYAQRCGAEILALLDDPQTHDVLDGLFSHANEAVRMAAAVAAGKTQRKDLADALARLADRPEEFAAFGALWALTEIDDERGLRGLSRTLEAGHAVLARAAFAALKARGRFADEPLPRRHSEYRRLARR